MSTGQSIPSYSHPRTTEKSANRLALTAPEDDPRP